MRKFIVLLKIKWTSLNSAVTCLMLKANTEPGFHGDKPKAPNKADASKSQRQPRHRPSKAAGFAKAQLRQMLHPLPAPKKKKSRGLIISYKLKKKLSGEAC